MRSAGQLLIGILTAAGSGLLVLAAISLALVEGGAARAKTLPPTASPTAAEVVLTPAGGVTLQPTLAQVITATQAPSSCRPPEGWVKYTVQAGDDVDTIAARAGLSTDAFMRANCMLSTTLLAGTDVTVPFIATETAEPTLTTSAPTRSSCGAPAGWVIYTVKSGDTLNRISRAVGVSVAQLQRANCLSNSMIITGMRLYVPFLPTPSPVATNTPVPSPSATTVDQTQPTVTATLPGKKGPTETVTLPPSTATAETPTSTPVTPTATPETPTATLETATPVTATPVPPTPVTPQAVLTMGPTKGAANPTEVGKTPSK